MATFGMICAFIIGYMFQRLLLGKAEVASAETDPVKKGNYLCEIVYILVSFL
jgi:Na+/glutamate symporter